jgi:hypothetical protein
MSKQSNKLRFNSRSRAYNKSQSNQRGGTSATSNHPYNSSIVRRSFQVPTTLTIAATNSTASGYVTWGSALSATAEFKGCSDLYAQCRLTRVKLHYAPLGFTSSTSPTYCGVVGAMAHDPTSQAFTGAPTYDDFYILPQSKFFASGGMGASAWKLCVYNAPLSSTQLFGTEANESSAGMWLCPQSMVDMIGATNFACRTQDSAVHATINQEVLAVVCVFDVEFRQPTPDYGAYISSKKVPYHLQTNWSSLLIRHRAVVDNNEEKKYSSVSDCPTQSEVPKLSLSVPTTPNPNTSWIRVRQDDIASLAKPSLRRT